MISAKSKKLHVAVASAMLLTADITAGTALRPVYAAQEKQYDFNIPRGRLSDAIPTYIRVTDAFIVHPDFKNLNTQGVKGRMTATQALEALLQGTGLEIAHKDLASPPTYRIEKIKPKLGAPKSDDVELPNIFVTARRRLEDVQDVPWSITVLTDEEIEKRRLYNLADLSTYVPGFDLQYQNQRSVGIVMHGTGSTGGLPVDGTEASVGVYIDGVYQARYGQTVADMLDVEQIEILQGPQGTFYGKNTGLGAINITTKAPTFTPEAQGEVTIGNYDYRHFRGLVSGPIVDGKLAARFFVAETSRDGFVENVATGQRLDNYENLTARGQLLFTPNDNVSFRLIGDYEKQDLNCCILLPATLDVTRVDGSPLPNNFNDRVARQGYTPLPFDPFRRETDADALVISDLSQAGVSGTLNINLGSHSLTSITAWRRWKVTPNLEGDYTALPVYTRFYFGTSLDQYTQEVRLASRTDQPISYVVGGFFYHLDYKVDRVWRLGTAAPAWFTTASTLVSRSALTDAGFDGEGEYRVNHYAAFGQVAAKLRSDLTLTVGLRYTYEDKEAEYEQQQFGPDLSHLPPGIATAARDLRNGILPTFSGADKLTHDDLSGDISLLYKLNENTNVYATYARGHKSPGLNIQSRELGTQSPAKAETVNHFEVGLKALMLDKRLSFNASLFRTTVDDFQTLILASNAGGAFVLGNAGGIRSQGVDIEVRAQPIAGLAMRAGAVYADAEYTSYSNAPCPIEYTGLQTVCDLSGRRLPNAPKWSLSASADYSWTVGNIEPFVGGDISYRSSQNWSTSLDRSAEADGYVLTNLRIGAKSALSDRWEVFFWAKNLFNEDYYKFLLKQGGNTGVFAGIPADPRTYGLTLRLKY